MVRKPAGQRPLSINFLWIVFGLWITHQLSQTADPKVTVKGVYKGQNYLDSHVWCLFAQIQEADLGVSNLKPTKHASLRQNAPVKWR